MVDSEGAPFLIAFSGGLLVGTLIVFMILTRQAQSLVEPRVKDGKSIPDDLYREAGTTDSHG